LFAGTKISNAQCTDDALHPIAGKQYDYIITTAGGGTPKSYEWIVTTSDNIVTSGTLTSPLASNATTYTMTGGSTANAKITWAPELIADAMAGNNNYYVVIKYVATNIDGCDVDNVKAYKIEPVNLFQISLANVNLDGSDNVDGNVCTSPVVGAIISGNGTLITHDYGTTKIYVKVTAQYFSGSWNMTVDPALLANVNGVETNSLEWSRTIGGTGTSVTPGTAVTIPETTTDPEDEEVIYLTFTLNHVTFEGLDDRLFSFIVNGTDQAGNPDVSDTCLPEEDQVDQTILERPEIIDGTDNGTFIPQPQP
jgi:hypothetical protein